MKKGMRKSGKATTILIILILLVLIAIGTILFINIKKQEKKSITEPEGPVIEELAISTEIFNHTFNETSLEIYLSDNPTQRSNNKKLSENLRDCKDTNADFSGGIPEIDGSLYIEDIGGESCFVSYRSDFIIDCNYTKDELKDYHNETKVSNMEDISGSMFYLIYYFKIAFAAFSQAFIEGVSELTGEETPEEVEELGIMQEIFPNCTIS